MNRLSKAGAALVNTISSNREIKNAPSALLSYISTREFLRTREKCFSHFSSVLKNWRVLIYPNNARGTSFLFL